VIPKECKRLAEVDFPIAVVSKHAGREKSIRQGHPSTLHLWWARRPLAACRAMLLGLLLPDPCNKHCPQDFKQTARDLLPKLQGQVGSKDEDLRQSLLKFIGDFADWDLSSDRTYLEVSRRLVNAAHPGEAALVVDPFAGGGAIPLEALRLGCEAFASDLNPVACLILKVMLEDFPRYATEKIKVKKQNGDEVEADGLADALRTIGKDIKEVAENELAEFYPRDNDDARPIAYLWSRTIRCEAPNCGAEIPLVRSFWLCKKDGRKKALRYRVQREKGKTPDIEFTIFEPDTDADVPQSTVSRGNAACPACNLVTRVERVRAQLAAQRGGADVLFDSKRQRTGGARMVAVVTVRVGEQGRLYRLPTEQDYLAVWKAHKAVAKILDDWERGGRQGLCPVPNEPISLNEIRRISVPIYGMTTWGDLFTARQKLALSTLAKLIRVYGQSGFVQPTLAMAFERCADHWSSSATWLQDLEAVAHTFVRQALQITWDYVEACGFGLGGASFQGQIGWVSRVIEATPKTSNSSQVHFADACDLPLPDDTAAVWFTDPPYYDAVPYAHLSDFFFVWLKRILPAHPLLGNSSGADSTTPKEREIVVDRPHRLSTSTKDAEFYQRGMARAFAEGRRVLHDDGVGSVVFAHKTTEGWEALLTGMIRAGWTITASWPIATERRSRLNARETAALATSVHLVCRPRLKDAPLGDWGEVHRELPRRVAEWMERLQSEHIRGADLVFACIGPALEIYSRYSKVVDAEDREIPLGGDPEATEPYKRGYLAYVWEAVGRAALEQVLGTAEASARNGAAGALEEDARLTALFLWTLQSTNGEQENKAKGKSQKEKDEEGEDDEEDEEAEEAGTKAKRKKGLTLVFDVVRRFAQPLGIHLDNWEDRIIETEKGIVRLLPVGERGAQLFGHEGADLVAERLERSTATTFQLTLFPDKTEAAPKVKGKKAKSKKGADKDLRTNLEATTLDRVHAAMLLQASGRTNGLRALLKAEQDRGPDFLRLANALSALYPKESEEKRLLDAMLLAVPR
jgi:adenine-specific DNA methylase